jgi:PBSX family phage portal protein
MPRATHDLDDSDDWEGYTNDDGEHNVIDEVTLDEASESFYRTELKKMVTGNDPFSIIPFDALDKNAKRRVKYQLKKRLEGQGGAKTKSWDVEQINGYELYDLALPPFNLDHLIDLSVENDTHWACISAKTTNIVGLGYKWTERAKVKEARQSVEDDDDKMMKLSRKLQRVTDSLDEWIEDLNLDLDFNEILTQVWMDVEATGNGYLEIGRMMNGKIGYVGHIPSATMRVRKWRDGFIQIVQDKLTFFRNFGDRTTADYFGKDPRPNEVMHFKKHSPKNSYYGVPDIIAAMSSVAGEKFSSEYNLDYFENKAVPRYALIVKGAKLSSQSERRILEYFRKEVKGKHHGTLYIPVPAHMGSNVDVKLEAIENKVQEGSFEKYRAGNRESIAMVHKVPKSVLGIGVGVAAAREDDKKFKVQVCVPAQRGVNKKVNRLVAEFTDMYTFELDSYDLLDAETISRIDDRYIRTGVDNPNEIRARRGMHPRKGGDKFLDLAGLDAAKIELTLAQAGQADAQAEAIPKQADAAATAAKVRSDASSTSGGGTTGPARQTTDGSPKNKQQTTTPAKDTAAGKATRGTGKS